MSLFDLSNAVDVGGGQLAPAGSVADPDLAKLVGGYKRTIASRYRAITPEELDMLPKGGLWVSPKIDGQIWFLVVEDDEYGFVAPNGKVLVGDIPVLQEVKKHLLSRARGRLVLAGELFAIRKGGRPRCGDLAQAIKGGEEGVGRIGFQAFDLLTGGDSENEGPMPVYQDRLEAMQRLCKGGKRLQAIKTVECNGPDRVKELFAEWVEGGKGEGLVARSKEIGRTFKIKPVFTIDAAVVAFTERADEKEQVRSLLLAVMKENGQFQIIGSCGNMGTAEFRGEVHKMLAPDAIPSAYSYASSSGALFKFVQPKMVVEIKVTDIQTEDSSGKNIKRMVLELNDDKWVPVAPMTGVSIIHPVLERIRDDKEVNPVDVRAQQILERVFIEDIDQTAEKIERPKSEVLRREVYTKVTKGQTAVRKLLMWKTNKEADPDWPAFVVHWTDYSPGRKDPLKREVRLAPTEEAAEAIAESMLAAGIKRGWKEA
ncbi:MAG: hypothetical protein AAGE52_36910 [Myxococcota bacterium]